MLPALKEDAVWISIAVGFAVVAWVGFLLVVLDFLCR